MLNEVTFGGVRLLNVEYGSIAKILDEFILPDFKLLTQLLDASNLGSFLLGQKTAQLTHHDVESIQEFVCARQDLIGWKQETVGSSVPHFKGEGQVNTANSVSPVTRTTGSDVEEVDNVSRDEAGVVSLLNSCGSQSSNSHVFLMRWEWDANSVWDQNVLAVAVKTEHELESAAQGGLEVGSSLGFRLAKGRTSGICVVAGIG